MARGARSARSQATRTWRRENLKVPDWQLKADEARYAALASAAAGPSVEPNRVPEEEPAKPLVQRGRRGKVHAADGDVDMEVGEALASAKNGGKRAKNGGGKGGVKGGGVQKRKPGKLYAIGALPRDALADVSMLCTFACQWCCHGALSCPFALLSALQVKCLCRRAIRRSVGASEHGMPCMLSMMPEFIPSSRSETCAVCNRLPEKYRETLAV
jgi:hypothetical protein